MNSATPKHPIRSGKTLLDAIAVLAILGLLLAITVPMLLTARDRSARFKCAYNLSQVGLAMRAYAKEHGGRLPSTRPSTGPAAIPDVTNSGKNAANPFADDGPAPNNVPAVLFLLMRTESMPSYLFVCSSTKATPDRFGGTALLQHANFTSLKENLSYSVQNPYADAAAADAGFEWNLEKLPSDFVLMADKSPGGKALLSVAADSPQDLLRLANSANHGRAGQNILYADGRVEFQTTPFAGINDDNIYTTRDRKILGSPRDKEDSILLPAEE